MNPKDSPSDKTQRSPRTDDSSSPESTTEEAARRPPPTDLRPRLGRYQVREVLGEGAFGRVYLAFDAELLRPVAIKVPHPKALSADLRERFLREARAAATIHHQNVCPIHDIGTEGEVPFLVMRYVPGGTLQGFLAAQTEPLPIELASTITGKIALGIGAAHAMTVIHRDLKPANVLWDGADREVLVTDFGLARIGGAAQISHTGEILGTPAYMSPEQARGRQDEVGPLSDVYSLGVILYRVVAGRLPFVGSVMEVLGQAQFSEPAPPSAWRPGLDARFDRLCLKAMAKKPEDRYASSKHFADALAEYVAALGKAESGRSSWFVRLFGWFAPRAKPKPRPPFEFGAELETTSWGREASPEPDSLLLKLTRPAAPLPPPPPPPEPVHVALSSDIDQVLPPGYQVVKLIGKGNFGIVYRVRGPGGFEWAFKVIDASRNKSRGIKEFRAFCNVRRIKPHRNLIEYHGVWLTSNGKILENANMLSNDELKKLDISELIVQMPLAEESLEKRLKMARRDFNKPGRVREPGEYPGIPLRELLVYMQGVAEALDHLHSPIHPLKNHYDEEGTDWLLHRNVKPGNILIDRTGTALLTDYGVTRIVGASVTGTDRGVGVYNIPAQLTDHVPDTHPSSDQYSLAGTYYELRTGTLPIPDESMKSVEDVKLAHILGRLDFSLLSRNEVNVLKRATHRVMKQRYPSCAEFVAELYKANGVAPGRVSGIMSVPTPRMPYSDGDLQLPLPGDERSGADNRMPFEMSTMPEIPPALRDPEPVDEVECNPWDQAANPKKGKSTADFSLPAAKATDWMASAPKSKASKGISLPPSGAAYFGADSTRTAPSLSPPKPGDTLELEIASGVTMCFRWVPAGSCQLGSPRSERDAVRAALSLTDEPPWLREEAEQRRGKFICDGFWMGRDPVTQAQWAAVMTGFRDEDGRDLTRPSQFAVGGSAADRLAGITDTANFPVENITAVHCAEFLRRATENCTSKRNFVFSLPHENEWEYACRGGRGNVLPFHFGRELDGTQANCDGSQLFGTGKKGASLGRPCAVEFTHRGAYGMHPWGLRHMHGNVYEWCANADEETGERILRGGSWSSAAYRSRSAHRYSLPRRTASETWSAEAPSTTARGWNIGFRVILVEVK